MSVAIASTSPGSASPISIMITALGQVAATHSSTSAQSRSRASSTRSRPAGRLRG